MWLGAISNKLWFAVCLQRNFKHLWIWKQPFTVASPIVLKTVLSVINKIVTQSSVIDCVQKIFYFKLRKQVMNMLAKHYGVLWIHHWCQRYITVWSSFSFNTSQLTPLLRILMWRVYNISLPLPLPLPLIVKLQPEPWPSPGLGFAWLRPKPWLSGWAEPAHHLSLSLSLSLILILTKTVTGILIYCVFVICKYRIPPINLCMSTLNTKHYHDNIPCLSDNYFLQYRERPFPIHSWKGLENLKTHNFQ